MNVDGAVTSQLGMKTTHDLRIYSAPKDTWYTTAATLVPGPCNVSTAASRRREGGYTVDGASAHTDRMEKKRKKKRKVSVYKG